MPSVRLKRIIDVIGHLAVHGPQTVTEVSNALSLPLSSVHDLMKAMVGAGVATSTSRGYDLGPVAARMAFKIGRRLDIVSVSTPDLERLQREVGFDVYLAVPAGNDVIYATRLRGRQGVNIDIPLGLPLYRHATAAGKLFAAYSPEVLQDVLTHDLTSLTPRTRTDKTAFLREIKEIRARGLSISREEAVTGIIGLAAPILIDNQIAGAAHISALCGQIDNKKLATVSDRLEAAVNRITQRLRGEVPEDDDDHEPIDAVTTPLHTRTIKTSHARNAAKVKQGEKLESI